MEVKDHGKESTRAKATRTAVTKRGKRRSQKASGISIRAADLFHYKIGEAATATGRKDHRHRRRDGRVAARKVAKSSGKGKDRGALKEAPKISPFRGFHIVD